MFGGVGADPEPADAGGAGLALGARAARPDAAAAARRRLRARRALRAREGRLLHAADRARRGRADAHAGAVLLGARAFRALRPRCRAAASSPRSPSSASPASAARSSSCIPYWCVEKGYARFVGRREDSEAWLARARGWIRLMHVDIALSMVVYTIATVAFYLLGAGVLHGLGRVPGGARHDPDAVASSTRRRSATGRCRSSTSAPRSRSTARSSRRRRRTRASTPTSAGCSAASRGTTTRRASRTAARSS